MWFWMQPTQRGWKSWWVDAPVTRSELFPPNCDSVWPLGCYSMFILQVCIESFQANRTITQKHSWCAVTCIGNACIFPGQVHSKSWICRIPSHLKSVQTKIDNTLFLQANYIHYVDNKLKRTFLFEFWWITVRHVSLFFL